MLVELFTTTDLVAGFWTVGGTVQNSCVFGLELAQTTVFANDMATTLIVSPATGVNLGVETIVVTFTNAGTADQTNVPVSCTIDGGDMRNDVIATIASGEAVDINFGTVDLSTPGDYVFEANCALPGDEFPDNDTKIKTVTNNEPSYPGGGPSSTADSNVEQVDLVGDDGTSISFTGCPGVAGVEDQTALFAQLTPGTEYTLAVTFGSCGGNYGGVGAVWIDWNHDYAFDPATELIGESTGTPGSAPWDAPVEFAFTAPADAVAATTVMRVMQRESGSLPLDPTGTYTWGSLMDFGIVVQPSYPGGGPSNTADSNVEQVDIAGENGTSISFTGCPGVTGVEDQTALVADLAIGAVYDLAVTFGTCGGNYGGVGAVWIDWNNDYTFDPVTELIGESSGTPGSSPWDAPVMFAVTVPADAVMATTRMRVMQRESGSLPLDPTGTYTWGSLMDFGINITEAACDPVTNLAAVVTGVDVHLTWEAPGGGGGGGEWLGWDDGINNDAIGLTSGGQFYIAARWDVASLAAYDGMTLTKIAIHPYSFDTPGTGTAITLKVWTGDNAANEVVSQDITYTPSEWNEYDYTTTYTIDASQEMWVGYYLDQPPGEYAAGCDAGPAVGGFGDMITLDGVTWADMGASYGLDYNWNLKIYVESGKSGDPIVLSHTVPVNNTDNSLSITGMTAVNTQSFASDASVDYYEVYVDGSSIGQTADLFMDDTPGDGIFNYCVEAVYDDACISDQVCIDVEVIVPVGPQIVATPDEVEQSLAPDATATQFLVLSNAGGEELTFDIGIEYLNKKSGSTVPTAEEYAAAYQERFGVDLATDANVEANMMRNPHAVGAPSDDLYDLQFEFACGDASGEAGIESDGSYIYTTKWNGAVFFRYELDGTFLGDFACGSAAAVRDLAYDGTYFYGGAAATTIFQCDFDNETLVSTFTAPVATRAIAYNDDLDGFYGNNWSDDITLYTSTGAVLNQFPCGAMTSFYGFAWSNTANVGEKLWGFSQDGSAAEIVMMDPATGTQEETLDAYSVLTTVVPGGMCGGLFTHNGIVSGMWTLGGIIQNEAIFGLELDADGAPLANDVLCSGFASPNSGMVLGVEDVIVKIKNAGTTTQTDIPFEVTVDGASFYTGVIAGPLAQGEVAEELIGTIDMSEVGTTWVLEGCTTLAGDENPDNDCKSKTVEHIPPAYCDPSGLNCTLGDEINDFIIGDISNLGTGCSPDGYGDYTAMSTPIEQGVDIEITWSSNYDSEFLDIYIDLNGDYDFEDPGEQVLAGFEAPVGGTQYTTTINVVGATVSETRLRAICNWNAVPTGPCGGWSYGEAEDYTVILDGGASGWLTATPTTGAVPAGDDLDIQLDFDATDKEIGIYYANLNFTNNTTVPVYTVPVTMIVEITGAYLTLDPDALDVVIECDPLTTTELVTLTNLGTDPLDFTFEVIMDNKKSGSTVPTAEEYAAAYQARFGIDLATDENVEANMMRNPHAVGAPSDDLYDLQFEFACGDASGEAGIESDGSYIYTTKWNGAVFFRYELDGTFLGDFACGSAAAVRDLAYDGTYFYGGAAATTIFQCDFDNETLVSTFTAPIATRAIAYNDDLDGFYGNNWSDDITLYTSTGAVLNQFPCGAMTSFYGFAWSNTANVGEKLWGFSQDGSAAEIVMMDPATGTQEETLDAYSVLTTVVPGGMCGGLFTHNGIVSGMWTLGGIIQNEAIFGLELDADGAPLANDVLCSGFASPNSGMVLGVEDVIVKIKNAGTTTQTDIPFEVTVDGASFYTGVIAGPLAQGEVAEETIGTIDMSEVGTTWVLEGCTTLAGDENPDNDCKSKTVEHIPPAYCDPSGLNCTLGDEINDFIIGDISNLGTGCSPDGYGDYTAMSTPIEQGVDIEITWSSNYDSEFLDIYIDLNGDYDFEDPGEQVLAGFEAPVGGTQYTTTINVVGATVSETRLRAICNWNAVPTGPCGGWSYGEAEDYTVILDGASDGWLTVDLDPTLTYTVDPGESMEVEVTFDATGLESALYTGSVVFTSNAGNSPTTLPCTMDFDCVTVCDPVSNLAANVAGPVVELTWTAPGGGGGGELTEGFETAFPPDGWETVTTNAAQTWAQVGEVFGILPVEGAYQASVTWDYAAQDEWLITPEFEAGTQLQFYSNTGAFGSTYLDHYYVKVSTDGGANWTELWDAVTSSTLDVYEEITIDLSAYSGNIMLAWQAVDGDGQGLWFTWCIDDIRVTSGKGEVIAFGDEMKTRSPYREVITPTTHDYNRDGSAMAIDNSKDAVVDYYEIYREGTSIGTTQNTNYNDEPGVGTFEYCVEVVYDNACISEQVCVDATVDGELEIPENFEIVAENWNAAGNAFDIEMIWEHSACGGGGGEWIRYDNGENNDAIGLTGGGQFYVAARWDAAALAAFDGMTLNKVAIHPYAVGSPGTGTAITLKVWTGANAANEVISQDITYTPSEWNEYVYTTGYTIDASTEMWVGYYVDQPDGDYAAGTDAGPAVGGYGDMITLDGASWEAMGAAYGLDYNWNIAAYVEDGKTGNAHVLGHSALINNTNTTLAASGKVAVNAPKFAPKGFSNFIIYDENDVEVGTSTVCEFTLADGVSEMCYYVTAMYTEGESDASNQDCTTGINDASADALNVYPNPATDAINIESNNQIDRITVFNMVGQVVCDRQVSEIGVITINTSTYDSGMYLIKVEIDGVATMKRITIAD